MSVSASVFASVSTSMHESVSERIHLFQPPCDLSKVCQQQLLQKATRFFSWPISGLLEINAWDFIGNTVDIENE